MLSMMSEQDYGFIHISGSAGLLVVVQVYSESLLSLRLISTFVTVIQIENKIKARHQTLP